MSRRLTLVLATLALLLAFASPWFIRRLSSRSHPPSPTQTPAPVPSIPLIAPVADPEDLTPELAAQRACTDGPCTATCKDWSDERFGLTGLFRGHFSSATSTDYIVSYHFCADGSRGRLNSYAVLLTRKDGVWKPTAEGDVTVTKEECSKASAGSRDVLLCQYQAPLDGNFTSLYSVAIVGTEFHVEGLLDTFDGTINMDCAIGVATRPIVRQWAATSLSLARAEIDFLSLEIPTDLRKLPVDNERRQESCRQQWDTLWDLGDDFISVPAPIQLRKLTVTVPLNEKGLVLSRTIGRTIKGWRAKNVTYTGE